MKIWYGATPMTDIEMVCRLMIARAAAKTLGGDKLDWFDTILAAAGYWTLPEWVPALPNA